MTSFGIWGLRIKEWGVLKSERNSFNTILLLCNSESSPLDHKATQREWQSPPPLDIPFMSLQIRKDVSPNLFSDNPLNRDRALYFLLQAKRGEITWWEPCLLSNKKGNKTSSGTGIADYWLSIRTLPTSKLCQGNPFLGLLYHQWQSDWVGPFIPSQSYSLSVIVWKFHFRRYWFCQDECSNHDVVVHNYAKVFGLKLVVW